MRGQQRGEQRRKSLMVSREPAQPGHCQAQRQHQCPRDHQKPEHREMQ